MNIKTNEYYCHKIIEVISKIGLNPENILAYLLLELKENEIVYISILDKWYIYDYTKKKWNEYDFKITISKISQLYEIFQVIFIKYIEDRKNELTDNNYNKLKFISSKMALLIYNNQINNIIIYEKCKQLFLII
jgi:hypothetical protein